MKNKILDYLCHSEDVDMAMNEVLSLVGNYFHVDRAYIFENSADGTMCSNTYEWCGEGITPQKDNLQNLRYKEDLDDSFEDYFDENGMFFCRSLDNLKTHARAIVVPQEITSMLQCAIRVHGVFKGYIGFDNCSGKTKGWENDPAAIDTLVYTSHLLTLFLFDDKKHKLNMENAQRKMQLRLDDADSLYYELLSNIDCGIVIYGMSSDGKITAEFMNEGLCKLAEGSHDEIDEAINKDLMFTINPEYHKEVRSVFKRIYDGENNVSVTYKATTLKNNTRWVMLRLSAERKDGKIKRIYGTFFDVTTDVTATLGYKKKYELEKQRSLNEKNTLAYAVFNLYTKQTIEMERRSPLKQLDRFMTLEEFRDDIANSIMISEQKQKFINMFNPEKLLSQYENGVEEQSMEFQRTLPGGKVIWAKAVFHIMKTSDGSNTLLYYYCKNINIQKSLENMTSYIANEDYDMLGYINFFDNSAIMLYGSNSSHKHGGSLVQEESYSSALDWFVSKSVVPEERETYKSKFFIPKIKSELETHKKYEFNVHIKADDGSYRTKKIRYTDYNAESQSCFFSQLDITDLLAKEEKKRVELQNALDLAKQSSLAKTSFLSRMSHDIRTPMNAILGTAALALDDLDDREAIKNELNTILNSGHFLLGLINDILDINKIESGKFELHPEVYPVKDFESNIESTIVPLMKKKNIDFRVRMNCGHIFLMTDPLRYNQIFFNLLSNAAKYTESGGIVEFVSLPLEAPQGFAGVHVEIRDNGIGMSQEYQKHIFEPFTRDNNASINQTEGSGLGLAIVKSIVDAMGGKISVKSEVGKGTEFAVDLVFPEVYEKEKKDEPVQKERESFAGKNVLLVEDNNVNISIAKRMLEKKQCSVTVAVNGKQAVEVFENSAENYFSLILMDIRMPVMDGLEAARTIRASQRNDAKTVPVIAMTADAFSEDVRNTKQAGMNAHLTKPVEPDKLYSVMQKYIR